VDSLQSLDGSHLPIETSLLPHSGSSQYRWSPRLERVGTVRDCAESCLDRLADFRNPNQNSNQVGHQPAQPSCEPNPLGIVRPGEKPHHLVAVVELTGQIPTSHFLNQRAIRQSGDHRTTNPGSTALAAAYLSKRKLPQDLLGESKQSELLSNRNCIPRS